MEDPILGGPSVVVWKCVKIKSMANGALFVMIFSTTMQQPSSAQCSVSRVVWPEAELILEKETAVSSLIMCDALEKRRVFLIANTLTGDITIASTRKTLALCAWSPQVWISSCNLPIVCLCFSCYSYSDIFDVTLRNRLGHA